MFTNRNSIIRLKIIGKTMIMNSMVTERSSYFCELKEYSQCVLPLPDPEVSRTHTDARPNLMCVLKREKSIGRVLH